VGFADLGFGGGRVGWGAQGANEAFSIVYTSKPLAQDVEILGFPRATVHVSTTAEVAQVAVRLCDVAPDGASTLVCKGLLNATRRNGMDRADPLTPGEVYRLEIDLDAISWIFPKGHAIRLAISGADFPEVWPSPHPAVLHVYAGSTYPSSLSLPVVGAAPHRSAPPLLPPAKRRSQFVHSSEKPKTSVAYDISGRAMIARRELKESIRHPDGVTVVTSENRTEMRVSATNPADAVATGWDCKTLRRTVLEVESTATAELKSDATTFTLNLALEVTINGSPYWSRRWHRTIPRLLL
jgi:hypothetical protein